MSSTADHTSIEPVVMPVLPLRDVVVFPHMVIPLFVGREKSIAALDLAIESKKTIFLAAQKEAAHEDPTQDDIYTMGTVAVILQMLKLPNGTVKVLVEGIQRGEIMSAEEGSTCLLSKIALLDEPILDADEARILARSLLSAFEQYVKLNKKIPPEVFTSLSGIEDIRRLTDSIIAHLVLKVADKQDLLEERSIAKRVEHCIHFMEAEMDLIEVETRIRGRVKKQMEKSQREYYLNEQMKAIQKELGDSDHPGNDLDHYEQRIKAAGMTKEAKEKARSELSKLRAMLPMSAEATVSRNYLDALINVPWKKKSKISQDLNYAEQILNADHYGLEEVKERILEYLAVQNRVKTLKGPVLCLVGPPGVGKTSLGESIARATGREFVRVSLGGLRDEAEIRGHRRTYIGALPGKIIQKLTKVGVKNPLFLLDEVDKMMMDYRGDPASALLEVLDPEQNHNFNDHYLEVDYDLSDILFVCTANSLNIPAPLLDRMEVIRISGYTEDEKIAIVEQHLFKKQRALNGLDEAEMGMSTESIRDIIRYYCREAGVRSLEREIAKICRKVVKEIDLSPKKQVKKAEKSKKIDNTPGLLVHPDLLEHYLGVKKYRYGIADEHDQIGQVTGLAWTEVGGELLHIEAASVPGKGKAIYTGHLGDVMQESIHAAMTVVRSRHHLFGIPAEFFQSHDIHVHVPEGATPKDGPSAGIGMCLALVSVMTQIPVRADVAMTGEITLRGEILPIGGLKEKLLAAHRGGIKTVIIPEENCRDLKDIPEKITQNLDIRPMRWIDQVLDYALVRVLQPLLNEQASESVLPVLKAKTPSSRKRKSNKTSDTRTH